MIAAFLCIDYSHSNGDPDSQDGESGKSCDGSMEGDLRAKVKRHSYLKSGRKKKF